MTSRKIPLRKCTGCLEMKPKSELVRVILTSDNEIIIDKTGKQNGRGAYICGCSKCLDLAMKNHGLEKSLKRAVPADIYDRLRTEM